MTEAQLACPLCGGHGPLPLVAAYGRMQAREEEYRYWRCAACGLVFLYPLPSPEEILGYYPDDYPPHGPRSRRAPEK